MKIIAVIAVQLLLMHNAHRLNQNFCSGKFSAIEASSMFVSPRCFMSSLIRAIRSRLTFDVASRYQTPTPDFRARSPKSLKKRKVQINN
jgi:hypothetical protein